MVPITFLVPVTTCLQPHNGPLKVKTGWVASGFLLIFWALVQVVVSRSVEVLGCRFLIVFRSSLINSGLETDY